MQALGKENVLHQIANGACEAEEVTKYARFKN